MIEKLSGKARDNMAAGTEKYTCGLPLVRAIIQSVCDYYDAQIDAQAKTMYELKQLWICSEANEKAKQYALGKSFSKEGADMFAEAISFFLATGGTIKDGE
jgi:hypothetical protein